MRIALVYDCLYPNTIGGAERWYRNVAERVDVDHRVTYLTRKQWGEEGPGTSFETVAVGPAGGLYKSSGNRSITAPLRFGWGVFIHLLRHGDRYDVVHTASFPYFSVLAAWAALRLRRSSSPLFVDWHEFWGDEYWRRYLGPFRGRVGAAIQALCLRAADRSFTFSRLVEGRLRRSSPRGPVVKLTGEYIGIEGEGDEPVAPAEVPTVVFAGRHIPEKRVLSIPPAIAVAREKLPDLRCVILGEGPDTDRLRELVASLGIGGSVTVPGRVAPEEVRSSIGSAACLLNPSEREGYGLVVVEAAALGTPTIVVEAPENAAPELIEPGVNGFIASSDRAEELADLIVASIRKSDTLRASTREWYERNREKLSISSSIEQIEAAYHEIETDARAQSPARESP
jgi:glycosyltransferase involved in cell wall biosynthesis